MFQRVFNLRIVCALLTAVLVAGALVPAAAAAADTAGDLLNETFDAYTAGQKPAGWKIPAAPEAVSPAPNPYIVSATVEEVPGYPGKALALFKNGKSVSSYNVEKAVSGVTTKISFSYKVRAEQTDAVVYLPSLKNGASSLKFALYGGQFAYMKPNGTSWVNIQPYVSGTWYDVKIVADTDAGVFDLYIDQAPKLVREPGAAGAAMTGFYLGMYKDSIGKAYFDDFQMNSYKPAVGAAFGQTSYSVAAGSSAQLDLRYDPADATVQAAAWTSDHPEIAAVTNNGVVTGVAPGSAVITAQPYEPIPAATVTVNVYEVPITGIAVAPVAGEVRVGSRVWLQATVSPASSTERQLVWGSDNPAVATVDSYGELTGVAPGTAKVYAATPDGAVRGETTVTVAARTTETQLYVAPSGDDANPGTEAAPFRTIPRAQQAVRQLNESMTGDIVVNLRAGTYTLGSSLQFGPDDSGRNGNFVVYRSYPGEKAVISGGQSVTGWTLHDPAKGIYKAYVGTQLKTRQLFVDGVRAIRARSEGGLTNPLKTATGYTSDDTFLADWSDAGDLQFVYNETWTNPRVNVQSVAIADGKAQMTMEDPGWTAATNKGMTSATVPVYYENAYELLDRQGEWYYSSKEGYIYYKPRAWENLNTAEVIAPVQEQLMNLYGASADAPVRNLQFEGLTFAYTTWMRPDTSLGHSDGQNNHLRYPGQPDVLPDAAIMLELANTVNFVRDDFTKLGVTGIRMQNGVQNSLVEGNRFYDISGGAVNVGQPNSNDPAVYHPTDPRLIMKNDDIVDNYIHDIGVEFKSAAALSAGFPVDMDIRHNEIYNIPYSGTHIGYGWAKDFDPVTRDVKIEDNLVYDLMGMGLRDGGAFYSLGTSGASADDKNIVSGNYVRNQMDIGAPLYADEGSAYWKYENNVIDLRESPPWSSSKRWAQAWAATIHDQDFVHNYTTEPNYINNGFDNTFQDNQTVPDGNWPAEAQSIIANSGLEPAYGDLATGTVSRWTVEPVHLEAGGTAQVSVTAKNGKDQPLDTAASRFYYESDNPAVATVDAQGQVTGVGTGLTTIAVRIVNGSVLRTLEADVFVGETLSDIRLAGTAGNVAFVEQGKTEQLGAYGNTSFGNQVALENVTYTSLNPDIVSVTADGRMTGLKAGEAVLVLKGTFLGVQRDGYYAVKVWNAATADDTMLRGELADSAGWYVAPTAVNNVQTGDGSITVATPNGGHAVYQGRQYLNEMLDFKLTIHATTSWYALLFGKQSATLGYNNDDNYLVVISAGGIELQRYNGGVRTVIYGSIPGYTSLGGPAAPASLLPFNEEHRVQLGALNEAGGVRLVLKIDGAEVFNYLDTAPEAIRKPGYFGLVSRSGSMTLAQTAASPQSVIGLVMDDIPTAEAGGSTSTAVVKAVYDDGKLGTPAAGISFSSSNPAVATADGSGTIAPLTPGTTVITATYGTFTSSRTLQVVDTTPPEWQAGSTVSVDSNGSNKAALAWPAARDTTGITRYEVQFGGHTYLTQDTHMEFKGLSKNNTYVIQIVAVDSYGNRSEPLEATLIMKTKPGKGN